MQFVVEVACSHYRGYIFIKIPGGAVRSACMLHQEQGAWAKVLALFIKRPSSEMGASRHQLR